MRKFLNYYPKEGYFKVKRKILFKMGTECYKLAQQLIIPQLVLLLLFPCLCCQQVNIPHLVLPASYYSSPCVASK